MLNEVKPSLAFRDLDQARGTHRGAQLGFTAQPTKLISIPVTNTSVNPARSTGPAIFVGGWVVTQLWLFWLAPILGAAVGALAYKIIAPDNKE